jgi:hypothetical protein
MAWRVMALASALEGAFERRALAAVDYREA